MVAKKDKVFDLALSFLKENIRRDEECLANYAFVRKDGTICGQHHWVCYAFLRSHYIKTRSPIKYFLDKPGVYDYFDLDKGEEVAVMTYLDWLLNKSNWSDVFLIKDAEIAFEHGMIFDAKFNPKWVLQGAILFRYIAEYPYIIHNWFELHPHLEAHAALILAHMVIKRTDLWKLCDHFGDGHQAFCNSGLSNASLSLLAANKPNFDITESPMAKGHLSLLGQDHNWHCAGERLLIPVGASVLKINTGPFGKGNRNENGFSLADTAEMCKEWLALNTKNEDKK